MSVTDLNFSHSSNRPVLMKWNVCHCEIRVPDRIEFCCDMPSQSHLFIGVTWRACASSMIKWYCEGIESYCQGMFDEKDGTKKEKGLDLPQVIFLLLWICIAGKETNVCIFSAHVCFSFCKLECFWHLGALCKIRCLSVYGLTTVGLWTEMEGNPKLLIPTQHNPQHCWVMAHEWTMYMCVWQRFGLFFSWWWWWW